MPPPALPPPMPKPVLPIDSLPIAKTPSTLPPPTLPSPMLPPPREQQPDQDASETGSTLQYKMGEQAGSIVACSPAQVMSVLSDAGIHVAEVLIVENDMVSSAQGPAATEPTCLAYMCTSQCAGITCGVLRHAQDSLMAPIRHDLREWHCWPPFTKEGFVLSSPSHSLLLNETPTLRRNNSITVQSPLSSGCHPSLARRPSHATSLPQIPLWCALALSDS